MDTVDANGLLAKADMISLIQFESRKADQVRCLILAIMDLNYKTR